MGNPTTIQTEDEFQPQNFWTPHRMQPHLQLSEVRQKSVSKKSRVTDDCEVRSQP